MKKYTIMALVLVILTCLGYLFGRYMAPEKVTIKKEYIKQTAQKEYNRVMFKQILAPDGTKTSYLIQENSKESSETVTQHTEKETINVKPQWKASALIGTTGFKGYSYGALVERRIIGPISAGVWGTTGETKQLGASLSIEF